MKKLTSSNDPVSFPGLHSLASFPDCKRPKLGGGLGTRRTLYHLYGMKKRCRVETRNEAIASVNKVSLVYYLVMYNIYTH